MSHFCEKCNRTLDDTLFYSSNNLQKYPTGKLNLCKKCCTMHVDNWNPETFLPILQEMDIPYVKEEWDTLLDRYCQDPTKVTGTTVIGRYVAKMKLRQWKDYRFSDTEKIAERAKEKKVKAMTAQGYSQDTIDQAIEEAEALIERPEIEDKNDVYNPFANQLEEEEVRVLNQLSEEDRLYLDLKWGRDYRMSEKVRMEQLYEDFKASYDIQGAGHEDTLKLICKTSLKANQLIDSGDIEGYQKMSKVYDSLMRSGRFTAAQNKGQSGEYVDSVGELVALCEKEGFIPRYHAGVKDNVDRTLEDLKYYTKNLVTEELNLGNLIENALREMQRQENKPEDVDIEEEEGENADIFDSYDSLPLEYKDYDEYAEAQAKLEEEDEKIYRGE